MSRSRVLYLGILAATLAACGGSSYGSPNPSCSGSGTNVSEGNGHVFSNGFNTQGTFTYQCLIHGAAMSGTIQVN